MDHDPTRARAALAAWGRAQAALRPIVTGHINESWQVVAADGRFVLQRLNPIFAAEIHHDIVALTAHLRRAGLLCAELVATRDGALWHRDAGDGVWRLQTFLDGEVHVALSDPAPMASAGRLLGRFHRALWHVQHQFAATRLGVHDTARHQRALAAAVAAHPQHAAHAAVAQLRADIDTHLAALSLPDGLPQRLVHGDPKLANILFSKANEARALIDLDTLSHMAITLELGDALRSWCNPRDEGDAGGRFSLPHFRAALGGYAAGIDGLLAAEEVAHLPAAVAVVALELAARFARDALEERYFGWDRAAYRHAWEHHLARARGQLALARSYLAQVDAARQVVAEHFGGPADGAVARAL